MISEQNIIQMFKEGHSIKYILKKAKASDKVFGGPNSEKVLLRNIEKAILKYWNSLK